MYADDIVLLADSPPALRDMIRDLAVFCAERNLTANLSKSEIMIFKKGEGSQPERRGGF